MSTGFMGPSKNPLEVLVLGSESSEMTGDVLMHHDSHGVSLRVGGTGMRTRCSGSYMCWTTLTSG